jgi:hypothetical protein
MTEQNRHVEQPETKLITSKYLFLREKEQRGGPGTNEEG